MARGGRRANAGRRKTQATLTRALAKQAAAVEALDKVTAREVVRTTIAAVLAPMLRKQIAHAMGIGHLYTRDKHGKFTKIVNEALADTLLTEGTEGEHYWIFMKDPSVQAFTDLMNRCIDKPKEQEVEVAIRDVTYRWGGDDDEDDK